MLTWAYSNSHESGFAAPTGWGMALWTEGQMKARKKFMLPVPPIGLYMINSSIADWQNLISISHRVGHKTKWVFASTPREHRDGVGYDRDFIAIFSSIMWNDVPSGLPILRPTSVRTRSSFLLP